MIKVVNNSAIVIKGLEKLAKNSIDTRSLMLEIAEDMKTKVDFRFRQTKNPNGEAWALLSPVTVAMRRGGSGKPLNDTGELKASITSKATRTAAIVGTNKEYAAYQNFAVKKGELGTTEVTETVREHTRRRRGRTERVRQHTRTRNVSSPWGDKPAREFIGFSRNQVLNYRKMINNYLKGGK